jgi:hypothetical protein
LPAALGSGEWRALTAIQNGGLVNSVAGDGGRTLVAGTEQGVFRSTNGGNSWLQARFPLSPAPIKRVVYSPRDGAWFAAGFAEGRRSGVYVSRDGGQSFMESRLFDLPVDELALSPDGGTLIAASQAIGTREPATLYRSDDGGQNWKRVLNVGDRELFFTAIEFSPEYSNDRTIFATAGALPKPQPQPLPGGRLGPELPRTYGTVFRSTDDGNTWLVRDQVAAAPPGTRLDSVWTLGWAPAAGGPRYTLYAGTDRGMATSSNGGDDWTPARDATQAAADKFVLDLVIPQAGGLVGVLCPRERALSPPDRGGIEWRDCETAVWNAASGQWNTIGGEFAGGQASRVGTIDMVRPAAGLPAIYLGADGGRVYLYSVTPFP